MPLNLHNHLTPYTCLSNTMMQIGSTLPANNLNKFQARLSGVGSRNNGSLLNPLGRACYTKTMMNTNTLSTTRSTMQHLSNLEKLIGTEPRVILDEPEVNQEPVNNNNNAREKSLLGGLNLPQIWPENKVVEEMSPRHLNRLRRLLSKNGIEYSPRNSLASRWREYHGSNNWSGLIDPLDENLRREMIRYGEFIQSAYHCFHSNPATSAEEVPPPRHVALPDRSYRVTKNLYATSSVGLPKWVDKLAPGLNWMSQRTSCIGYVAVCDDQREISRMGRRDIVISLRGTATCCEWAENMRDLLVQVPGAKNPSDGQPKVECGFLSLYKTAGSHVSSLAESVVEEVKQLTELYKGETLSITVTGHSLGAALALLVADDLSTCAKDMPPIAVYTFGGPRVGNQAFAKRLCSQNVKVLRIVNSQDLITRVPGMFVSEQLDKKLRETNVANKILNILDNNMPWAYAHVGTELRVDTKSSPYLKPDADVACCHDLEAYLHLVDGFLASNCPFRANAKRSLVKLAHEQNSNMKKLYTRAPELKLNFERGVQLSSCLPSPS
ncbi:phospholipase A1-Ibeta2, chloroplastic-like [Bidens hawaiensis]|uniref:phospholipase A1-Ibeta2, chloroplastic-like n=1 Tax=Bidens hawaiensis TaxID=980011 RepID=UPI00404A9D13